MRQYLDLLKAHILLIGNPLIMKDMAKHHPKPQATLESRLW